MAEGWKIGALAKACGVSARALRHYHALGLLVPSGHCPGDHRVYTAADLARLQHILALKALGFSLDEVRACLDDPRFSAQRTLALHIEALDRVVAEGAALRERLKTLARGLESASGEDDLLTLIKETTMIEEHYTPEQLERLKARAEALGPERIKEAEQAWPKLIAEVQALVDGGADPRSAEAQALAERWMALVAEFTGGAPDIQESLGRMYRSEPAAAERYGLKPELFAFIRQASGSEPEA